MRWPQLTATSTRALSTVFGVGRLVPTHRQEEAVFVPLRAISSAWSAGDRCSGGMAATRAPKAISIL